MIDSIQEMMENYIKMMLAEIDEKILAFENGKLIKNDENLINLLNDVANYYLTSKDNDYKLFNDILEFCDKYVKEQSKVDILLHIPKKKIFKKYALKYHSILKKQLDKIVFFNQKNMSELDSVFEYQEYLDVEFGTGVYKAYIFYTDCFNEVVFDFYQLFKDVLHFKVGHNLEDFDQSLFYYQSFDNLISFFYLVKDPDKHNLILNIILNNYYEEMLKPNYYYQFFKDNTVISEIFSLITEQGYRYIDDYFFQNRERYLLEVRKNLPAQPNDNVLKILSIKYFENLNFLKQLPRKFRKGNCLYLKCYQIFLNEFLVNFNEEVNNGDLLVIEALFQRIIEKGKLLEILQIDNKKTLYHYFKTDRLIRKISLTLDQIKEYNVKLYLQLVDKSIKKYSDLSKFNKYTFLKNKEILCLELMVYLGYDFLIKSNLLECCCATNVLEKIKNKDKNYLEKFRKTFSEDFSVFKDEKNVIRIIEIFDYFYADNDCITLNKIKKHISSGKYMLFPNNYHLDIYLEKLNFVSKGEPLLEKIEGIKLYQKYRFRLLSSIPDINGQVNEVSYQMVDLHDPNIISNGIGEYSYPNNQFSSSCLTPNGKAKSCLEHGALNPQGRFFKVTYQDKILAYSWVWRRGDVVCFDNIEVTKDLYKINDYENIIAEIYLKVAKKLIEVTENEVQKIKLVILGKNKIDISIPSFLNLPQVNYYTTNLYQPSDSEKLYLKDSNETQIILAGEYHNDLNLEDVTPLYLYPRKKVCSFQDLEEDKLLQKLNGIYFDYCIDKNITYKPILKNPYIRGFYNEDWFIGYKNDLTKDFFYCGPDERLFNEVKSYDHKLTLNDDFSFKKVPILKNKDDKINYLLDYENYILLEKEISDYLKSDSLEKFVLSKEDYLHNPSTLKNFANILLDNEINSAERGKRTTFGGANGKYFISVAKIGTPVYCEMLKSKSFILSENMCVFNAYDISNTVEHSEFVNTDYPLRTCGLNGEYQVLNYIPLSKAKGIFVSIYKPLELAQIICLQELMENQLPLVLLENNEIIDKKIIKKYIKLK